jgi:hypothetical protein
MKEPKAKRSTFGNESEQITYTQRKTVWITSIPIARARCSPTPNSVPQLFPSGRGVLKQQGARENAVLSWQVIENDSVDR